MTEPIPVSLAIRAVEQARGVLEGNYCPDCGKPVGVVNG